MDLKQIAKDTTKTLISYVTYQAYRVIVAQLDETEPKRAYWLRQFAARVSVQNGEVFIETLFREEPRLAFRMLTVRETITEEVAEYLPEMLRTGIQQANLQQRTQQLERMTQVDPEADHQEESLASSSEDLSDDPNVSPNAEDYY